MQTVKRPDVHSAPAKQQQPMGFREFNHCVDILLGGLPGIGHTAQPTTDKQTTEMAPLACTCWDHSRDFPGQQAA